MAKTPWSLLVASAVLAVAVLLPTASPAAGLEGLKIGVVNMNKALNESDAGQRSKKILLAARSQKQSELKAKEDKLNAMKADLKNNIMLSKEARARKEQEVHDQEAALRREVQKAQKEIQSQERKLTESIFLELRTVLDQIGKDEKFDLILEQNASQVVLFHTVPFIDVTDELIKRYNKFQKSN